MSLNTYIMPVDDAEREQEARAAAHLIYNASMEGPSPQTSPPLVRVTGTNGVHPTMSVPGSQLPPPPSSSSSSSSRQSGFSAVRRVFCLLATFDLLLTAILWFIYIQIIGLGTKHGFYCQIQKYNFGFSLFDIVAMAFFRMTVLLLAYALYKSKHWIFAALTTIATSGLLVTKIFLFDFNSNKNYPEGCAPKGDFGVLMPIVIIICSLVIAWVELWVFDFRVIPREKQLLEEAQLSSEERRPLLAADNVRRYDIPGGQAFYSPYDSPRDSDSESINSEVSSSSFKSSRTADFQSLPNSQRGSTVDLAASTREQEYIQKAKDALVQLQAILENTAIWKKECEDVDASVYCGSFPGISQRLYKLEAILSAPVETMVELLWDRCGESAEWNHALLEAEKVQDINPFIDILYSVAAPGGKGVFTSRDFVSVRLCEQRGERYVSSAIAVEHPAKPPVPAYVRGENGVSGWVLEPVPDRPGHCRYIWIINSDLKLKVWTPQNIMDPVMGNVILGSYQDLAKHLIQIQSTSATS